MKQGLSLQELAATIKDQQSKKRDFLASTENMTVVVEAGRPKIRLGEHGEFGINQIAHRQIATHAGIPAQYYDRMAEQAPDLLATNINEWFRREPKERLLRTLDGTSRAFLSDRYRPLEYSDLAEAVLPVLMELGVVVMSAQITESRLYIKAVDEKIMKDLPAGVELGKSHQRFDTVSPAIVITDSEVGMGALGVETGVWTGGCTNLAIIKQRSMRKYHVGGKMQLGEDVYKMLSDNTRKLTDAALWSQVKDIVKGAFNQAQFDALTDEIAGMSKQKIVGDPIQTVSFFAQDYRLTETEEKSILDHLIRGGDLTRYGLFNAVTRTAEDLDDYDRATEFERLGGEIIAFPKKTWKEYAEAEEQAEDEKEAA